MAPTVWYHVRDLDEGRRLHRDLLGCEELAVDFEERWSRLRRVYDPDGNRIQLAQEL